MLIRPALLNDVQAILEIERQSESAAHWTENKYREILENHDRGRRVLVAEENYSVQGFGVIRFIGAEAEIENLVVAPESRRRGLGKGLLQALSNIAQEEGATRLFLEVRESNAAARALYNGIGMQDTGRRNGYYQNPAEAAILYSTELQRGMFPSKVH